MARLSTVITNCCGLFRLAILVLDAARRRLSEHFGTTDLKGLLVVKMLPLAINGCGVVCWNYAQQTHRTALPQLRKISVETPADSIRNLIRSPRRNLELEQKSVRWPRKYFIVQWLDNTVTPMGTRFMRTFGYCKPKRELNDFAGNVRRDCNLIEADVIALVQTLLKPLGDIERIGGLV